MRAWVAIAPALIIGLRGVPVSGSRDSSLNASPLGSTSMHSTMRSSPLSSMARAYANGFDIDCIVNRWLRSEEHTSELQSRGQLVCRLLLEQKKYTMRLL